jgi:hypothetical protein
MRRCRLKRHRFNAQAIPPLSVLPDRSDAAVHQNCRRYPPLGTVNSRSILRGHQVLPLPVIEQERIEIRQLADQPLVEPGMHQRTKIPTEDLRPPALDIDMGEAGLPARPYLTRLLEGYARP